MKLAFLLDTYGTCVGRGFHLDNIVAAKAPPYN